MLSSPFASLPLTQDSAARSQRPWVRRWCLLAASFGFVDATLALAVAGQRIEAGPWLVQVLYHALGLGLFYVVLRWPIGCSTGRHLRPSSLAYAQLLFSVSAIALGWALVPAIRAAALPLLCLALVVDMQRLEPRQMRHAAWLAAALFAAALAGARAIEGPGATSRLEVLGLLMAAMQLPILLVLARQVRQLRQRQTDQRIELQDTLQQLENLSNHDSLTGLLTRQPMQALLEAEVKRQRRSARAFCMAIVDIDHFKRINDQHGHAVGDAVLREVAQLARSALSPADAIARWGGKDFVVLMPETTIGRATATLDHIRRRVDEHGWHWHADGLRVQLSAGVTEHVLTDALEATFERTDKALHLAKARQGGGIVALGVNT